jgi:hypothetical protein
MLFGRNDILSSTPLIGSLFGGPIDIVGDIHGEIDALRDLLGRMGYDGAGKHRDGRRLVFIGDLTDRGPDSPAVIKFVSALVAPGLAQCVLGNHELNLLRDSRKEGNGWYFEDNHDHRKGKFATAKSVPADNRPAIQAFLQSLPLALERSDLRLVHAAWHPPSVAAIRDSTLSVMELYAAHESAARRLGIDMGLVDQANAELARYESDLKNHGASMPLLPGVAALDALNQDANPIRIVTSGLERIAKAPFFASGQWRMADRVRWWNDYTDSTPVIVGHYWRWPTAAARSTHSRGEPDLFSEHEPHHWFGARRNVFCVDFAVGARFKERLSQPTAQFQCRLAAVRWPERQLIFDDGRKMALE